MSPLRPQVAPGLVRLQREGDLQQDHGLPDPHPGEGPGVSVGWAAAAQGMTEMLRSGRCFGRGVAVPVGVADVESQAFLLEVVGN